MSHEELGKEEGSVSKLSFAQNKLFYTSSFVLFCLWLLFCWRGLSTVVEIWYGNEIFNHGFFIVPGAIYLIYLKRDILFSKPIETSWLALIVIIPALLLYIIGIAGSIQLFLHAATFTLLPALIWLVIGTKAAKTVLFPLIFMLFSIPVGEQLIPYLQEIAADGSVALLRLTDVPLFRSGLYIEIPQGRFLVAEACSGVSFFIASFVIGSLYAYLNLVSSKRRLLFVATSLAFPILANIVRVYGIILIAYWTDMEHAAGADHLIYGWFFFAFVIVCLLGIGELMRQSTPEQQTDCRANIKPNAHIPILLLTITAFLAALLWQHNISRAGESLTHTPQLLLSSSNNENCTKITWEPVIVAPDFQEVGYLNASDCGVKIYTAWFSEVDNELVSDLHRVFDPEHFSLNKTEQIDVNGLSFTVHHIVSLQGEQLSVVRWYEIDDKNYVSAIKTKIHQLKNKLGNQHKGGRMWVLATHDADLERLSSVLEKAMRKL